MAPDSAENVNEMKYCIAIHQYYILNGTQQDLQIKHEGQLIGNKFRRHKSIISIPQPF